VTTTTKLVANSFGGVFMTDRELALTILQETLLELQQRKEYLKIELSQEYFSSRLSYITQRPGKWKLAKELIDGDDGEDFEVSFISPPLNSGEYGRKLSIVLSVYEMKKMMAHSKERNDFDNYFVLFCHKIINNTIEADTIVILVFSYTSNDKGLLMCLN